MNKLLQYSALAVFIGAGATTVAQADVATTGGGIKIKTDDGKFDASIGGRIHFDYVYADPDSQSFGSGKLDNNSGTYFRRVFLSLAGHLYGWEYHIDEDLAGNNSNGAASVTTSTLLDSAGKPVVDKKTGKPVTAVTAVTAPTSGTVGAGFNDVWIAHSGGFEGTVVFIGQHKPWRSLDEMSSNNDILFMERNVISASGIYGGRDYQQGVFYRYALDGIWAGASLYSLHSQTTVSTEGFGANARLAWAPINSKGRLIHIGGSFSSDHADNGTALSASYRYAGYRLGSGTSTQTFAAGYGSSTAQGQVNSFTAEAIGTYGPLNLSFEYAGANFLRHGISSANVDAYVIQGSWFITGETKPYKAGDAALGNPKPLHPYGAVEAKVKYEFMENSDYNNAVGPGGCAVNGGSVVAANVTKCQMNDISFGLNWYVNPAVRFMLDYVIASADLGKQGKDEPSTIGVRTQIAF